MIYSEKQFIDKLDDIIKHSETEIVEFKEAKNQFNFNDIGKYFSALSNEANLRGKKEAWLLFGIMDDGNAVGTQYRNSGTLRSLKKEIPANTNERMTFLEIYDLQYKGKRVIAFQIPPAIRGIPTVWNGAAWSREGESLAPLPLNKLDEIRSQIGIDWSKEIVQGATFDDLDPEAVSYARELFIKKNSHDDKMLKLLEKSSDIELLNKAGILLNGEITNTALILLGKAEAFTLFDGFIPRITWTLYGSNNSVRAYEHFDMPMLMAVDKAYSKIRNESYRYIAAQGTLFPEEVKAYDEDVVKELLNNCIAHSNYQLRGKINLEEFEDRLVFINEGNFIPETVERALEDGYKPPYYRNAFLCNAMVNLFMIDTISMGIPKIYSMQRDKCFPLPTYDLDEPNRVKVTLYGQIIDKNYTTLLHEDRTLDMQTVFMLDKIQKKLSIKKEEYQTLKKRGLSEGRYPNIYVSLKVADAIGDQAQYMRNKGLKNGAYKQLILEMIDTKGKATKSDIMDVLLPVLPDILSIEQKKKKVTNLLQSMKNKDKTIINEKDGAIDYWIRRQ